MSINSYDLSILKDQLGHLPDGALRVVSRNQTNNPSVILVDPLINKKPFPTIFWLTCPILKKQISHLEKDGLIKHLEKNKSLIKQTYKSHLRYQALRIQLLNKRHPDWKNLSPSKIDILKNTGIGGIKNFSYIKCFHLHYAHFLADANPIGQYIHQLLTYTEVI